MPMSQEQLKQIREQLMQQTESMSEPQKSELSSQISSMNDEQLEQFLIQNKMIRESESGLEQDIEESKNAGKECVFCSILQGKIPSYKLDENKSSLAILEINPLSRGHAIVISKKHEKLASSSFSLANKIAKRIKSKLKASDVKIENISMFGHHLIQIIPIYKGQELKKTKADERELVLLQEKLKAKPRKARVKKIQVQEISSLPKAPRRIP